jgi:hypothetical protein
MSSVNFITLMSKGEKYLKESIFTHQDRMFRALAS